MAKDYKVFISHSWSHIDDLKNLRNLLEQRGYFNVDFQEVTPDKPINSENTYYIRKRLKERISESDIVLGIAGVYASYSEWMEWELQTAENLNIPVVGVIPRGQERISQTVKKYAKDTVRWNTESIVNAIRIYAK